MSELEQNESTGEFQLKVVFKKGIKGDFYDAVDTIDNENEETGKVDE